MAQMIKNLGRLFSDTRARLIILLTLFFVVLAIGIGLYSLGKSGSDEVSAQLQAGGQSVRSVPGALDPTEQYAELQEEQNIRQAERAKETGESAIPTIIQSYRFGEGEFIDPDDADAGAGFVSLTQLESEGGLARDLWLTRLAQSNCDPQMATAALAQGASMADLAEICTCPRLLEIGYTLKELKPVCDCTGFKALGLGPDELSEAGYSVFELFRCGFDACSMQSSGFSANDLYAAGYTSGELRGAGFSAADIQNAIGLPAGVTAADVRAAGCTPEELRRLRQAGVSAAAIRKISGCSAEDLRAAGFTADELKAAGFSAAELRNAGFTEDELKAAGFSAAQLKAAGFVSPGAELQLPSGISADDLRNMDCSPATLQRLRDQGVSAAAIQRYTGCSVGQLRAAGFTDVEMAGVEGDPLAKLREAGCTVEAIRQAREAGISAAQIRQLLGCSAEAMRAAGFSAAELKDAGFSAAELKNAGFGADELKAAGFSAEELKAAGFSAAELKAAGFSPRELRDAGFSADELKAAGFSAAELKAAGFSAQELKAAGFPLDELKAAGFNAAQLREAGFSPQELTAAGFSVDELRAAGFTNEDLQRAGVLAPLAPQAQVAGLAAEQQVVPVVPPTALTSPGATELVAVSDQELDTILAQQAQIISEQQLEQDIQQRRGLMAGQAGQLISTWSTPPTQFFAEGTPPTEIASDGTGMGGGRDGNGQMGGEDGQTQSAVLISAGDILFGVLNTAVNSDEPGPILATIVAGELKGAKLIGSLSLPTDGQKVILSFNTMSIPNAPRTISINAVAVDPETARTALSSRTNNHYLLRYGSLFAAAFLQGFGQAFNVKGTTIEIDGVSIATENIGRTLSENAIIGLSTVGERWGDQLDPIFNRRPTVQVFSGTALGILFTQDVAQPDFQIG
ncbi:MAG: type IVB secretion system protein DotG/IcmE [Legionellales bacterium]|nr:type IVB secretion system protein DotG/IcmE [Legionellales bacterium]